MIDESRGKVIIAEADFDLARFSKTQQVNEQIIVTPKDEPGVF